MRKIIQMTAAQGKEEEALFLALCDDGTLWIAQSPHLWNDNPWERVANVPQGIEPTDKWPRS